MMDARDHLARLDSSCGEGDERIGATREPRPRGDLHRRGRRAAYPLPISSAVRPRIRNADPMPSTVLIVEEEPAISRWRESGARGAKRCAPKTRRPCRARQLPTWCSRLMLPVQSGVALRGGCGLSRTRERAHFLTARADEPDRSRPGGGRDLHHQAIPHQGAGGAHPRRAAPAQVPSRRVPVEIRLAAHPGRTASPSMAISSISDCGIPLCTTHAHPTRVIARSAPREVGTTCLHRRGVAPWTCHPRLRQGSNAAGTMRSSKPCEAAATHCARRLRP